MANADSQIEKGRNVQFDLACPQHIRSQEPSSSPRAALSLSLYHGLSAGNFHLP